jgi:hypothetical protein
MLSAGLNDLLRRARGKLALSAAACVLVVALPGAANAATWPTGGNTVTPTPGSSPVTPPPGANPVTPCSDAKLHLRCPDHVMSAPFDLHLDRTSYAGHVLLRATSSVNNYGSGPLELRAHRRKGGPWVVQQAIYDRRGRAHLFATTVQLVYKSVPGYRYGNPPVGDYSYWKVQHVAAFELWSIDAHFHAVRLVSVGPKVDYCLRDLIHTRLLPRSPANPVYAGCSLDPGLRTDIFGTSVGWSDVYPYEYPQQWVDVTGLHGRFAFVMIVDPLDLLAESGKRNNVSETYVELPSGRVLGQRVGVSAP